MQSYPFIFSDKYKLRRHLLFWFCWWAFQSILYAYTAGLSFLPDFQRLPVSSIDSVLFLVPHMFLTYSMMYFVVPKLLLRSKYILTAVMVLFLFFITASISAFIGVYVVGPVRHFMFPHSPGAFSEIQERLARKPAFFLSLLAGLRGAITVAGLASCIKLMKYWYIKEQNNLQLLKENTEAQLQLLKAQVHPHFLFNTLNNIYSQTQTESPKGSKMITGLSDLRAAAALPLRGNLARAAIPRTVLPPRVGGFGAVMVAT